MTTDRLRSSWTELLIECGADPGTPDRVFDDVAARYSEPHREYHTLAHIEAVVRDAHRLGVQVGLAPDDLQAVLLAAWLHDVVYDTHAQDNEDRSAELAHAALRSCGIRERLVESCCRMIRATATHEASCLADAVLMDADLAILAAPTEDYRRYARQIRAEYAWVPKPDYRTGRTEVLRNLLDRTRLFTAVDDWFDIDRARANVEAELRSLSADPAVVGVTLCGVSDDLLSEQMAYYRRRAAEYDATAYGDLDLARARIARLVPQLRPSGDVLEIACGTGLWTDALAGQASTVTAIDAAPEAIRIAQQRVTATNITFAVADIFSWDSHARFDTIFFSAWLSHVPATHFETFWRSLRGLLADGGRVLFVDEHVAVRDKEAFLPGHQDIVTRTLQDGSQFHIVKEFVDPHQLTDRLTELGWHSRIDRDGDDWIVGEARPAEP